MKSKVVIVGTGLVGMSYAYALLNQGVVSDLVLIDIDDSRAEGEAMDLNHGIPFSPRHMNIYAGRYDDCKDADLVVITAGVNQKPDESRLDLLDRNAVIMRGITRSIMESGFKGILLVASNPVDVMTQIVYEASQLPKEKVIGSGTSLDTARLRYEIGHQINIDTRNVHAYILGEHGESEFVVWSNAYVGAKPIKDVIKSMHAINFEDLDHIAKRVKNAAGEIIARKSATYYGIGISLVRITSAIINNENRILPLSVLNQGEYDCAHIYIGLPAVINKDGIHHIVELSLDESEKASLKHSANTLKYYYDQLH